MSSQPSTNPVVQQLQLLLTGYGYNFYDETNIARSDDQLVRERASYHLAQAVALLATLRGVYQRRFIPPLTRANPDPPAEEMAQVREMEEVQQALSTVETHIRGMSVPARDRIWWRFRQERQLLQQLWDFDLRLLRSSEQVYQYVTQLDVDRWKSEGSEQLRKLIGSVEQVARERERFLLLQV